MYELGREKGDELKVFSMYDETSDADCRYFPQTVFTGFAIKKRRFVLNSVRYGVKCDLVVLSHINLLLAGYLIKLFSPKTKLVLIAHGIEAWGKLSFLKRKMLLHCDRILAVSEFTKNTLMRLNHIPSEKFTVLNNCLDPYLQPPVTGDKSAELLKRYGFTENDTILMTVTRLAAKERYKGYDIVITSLHELRKQYPGLKYLIVGKYDTVEKRRLDKMIREFDLKDQVVFAGFIPDEELSAHFNLADIYIMPSEKEGFGIVFIEAMYYHKPVIAGNKDGSVDALINGKLGLLVNPESEEEVSDAIKKILANKGPYLPDHALLMKHFSYPVYREKWRKVLEIGNGQ
jgi:glycosyltransferase involved in cell wall biosynthesis